MGQIKYFGALFTPNIKVTRAIRSAAETAALFGLLSIKTRSRVRTGLMRDSWRAEPISNGIQISNPVPYTSYQEFGTSKGIKPMHAMTNSLPFIQEVFKEELAKQVGSQLANKVIGRTSPSEPSYKDKGVNRVLANAQRAIGRGI